MLQLYSKANSRNYGEDCLRVAIVRRAESPATRSRSPTTRLWFRPLFLVGDSILDGVVTDRESL